MRRGLTAMIVASLGVTTVSACGIGGSSDSPTTTAPRNAAVADCAGNVCRVRLTCKGRLYIRRGTAPVRIRTAKSALKTTIIADFAGSGHDAVITC